MSELQEAIREAYILTATVPVTGDQIEVMAAAREHLRRAYKLAAPEQKEVESVG